MPSAQSWVPSNHGCPACMCMRMRCVRAGGVLSVTVCLVIGDGLISGDSERYGPLALRTNVYT